MGRGQSPAPAIPMSAHQREILLSLVGKHLLGQQLAKTYQDITIGRRRL